jgi:tetratricopeptide (TPR) repeat protein
VFHIVQREVVLLVLLSASLIPLFIFTRSMAARNRSMNVGVAKAWYRLGQEQLEAKNTTQAIESFRNAATNDHDNTQYMLVLANALAETNHFDEARQILLRLRTSEPENGEVNLAVARLSVEDAEISDAIHYYHSALFGVWPPDQTAAQRTKVRTELIRFLLATGETSQALAELLILSSDIPDSKTAHNEIAQLFLNAGDSQHALEQFDRSLRLNGKDVDALNGAGEAMFNLADYHGARRYLAKAVANGSSSPEVKALLETAGFVISLDPLASGIRRNERIRRLLTDLDFASENLQSCIREKQGDQSSLAVLGPLWREMDEDRRVQLRPQELERDSERFTTGLSLIQRVQLATEEMCGRSSSLQRALLLIAGKHGIGEQ